MSAALLGALFGSTLLCLLLVPLFAWISRKIVGSISRGLSYIIGAVITPFFGAVVYNFGHDGTLGFNAYAFLVYGFGAIVAGVITLLFDRKDEAAEARARSQQQRRELGLGPVSRTRYDTNDEPVYSVRPEVKSKGLNGWQRIWVVCTAIGWIIGGLLFPIAEANKLANINNHTDAQWWDNFELGILIMSALVAALSALVYLAGWLAAWIRRGFTKS